jgi:hypothetical protein
MALHPNLLLATLRGDVRPARDSPGPLAPAFRCAHLTVTKENIDTPKENIDTQPPQRASSVTCDPLIFPREHITSAIGEAVLLAAAARSIWARHGDQASGQSGVEVGRGEVRAVAQAQAGHEVVGAGRLGIHDAEEAPDLLAYLFGNLFGCSCGVSTHFGQGVVDDLKHEADEGRRLPRAVASVQGFIIAGLLVTNQALDRHQGKQRAPTAQDKGLPQAAHAAIAVDKGMDEFEFIVEDAGGDERVVFAVTEALQQIVDQSTHLLSRRGNVDQLIATLDTSGAGAEPPRVVDQTRHQHAVG